VQRIAESMSANDCDPWFDLELEGGKRWWDQILEQIRACDVFVFVLSPRSVESVPCYFELRYALQLGRPILPLLSEPIGSDQRPPESLLPIQWVDVADGDACSDTRLGEALRGLKLAPLPAALPKPPVLPNLGQRRVTFVDLEAAHLRLESLVTIYSVVAWRSAQQAPPTIKEDSPWGGTVFSLECEHIQWGVESRTAELFSCFLEKTTRTIDGEEHLVPNVTPNEDYHCHFEWRSLFDTTLNVEISPERERILYALRDELENEATAAAEEGAERFAFYVVGVREASESHPTCFLAAEGYYDWSQTGGVWGRDGWVVHMRRDRRLTLDEVAGVIDDAVRCDDRPDGLQPAGRVIREAWSRRSGSYLEWLVANHDRVRDMVEADDAAQ
jgi:hypothetical protein